MGRMVANMVAVLCVAKAMASSAVADSHGRRPDIAICHLCLARHVCARQGTRGRPPPAHLRRLPLRERSNSQKHAMKTLIN